MQKTLIIAKRELKSYFDSPVAYIVIVAFLGIAGWMYFSSVFLMGRADLRGFFAPFSPAMFISPAMLLVLFVPAVTMRLLAEEKKSGTIELLTTLPVRDHEIVLGKFLAAFALFSVAVLSTVVYPITISTLGPLDWGPVIGGYVGMLLFVGSLVAVGLLTSSLTENQIVALILGVVIGASLYFMYLLQFFFAGPVANVIEFLALSSHLENLARGVLDTRDILYYLSLSAAALFISVRMLENEHA